MYSLRLTTLSENKIDTYKRGNYSKDELYTIAHDSFMDAVGQVEEENPSLKSDEDEMWYDSYIDEGIIDALMDYAEEILCN